jgi:hypothetical protein
VTALIVFHVFLVWLILFNFGKVGLGFWFRFLYHFPFQNGTACAARKFLVRNQMIKTPVTVV